jgi:hypothetical protein
MKPTRLLMSAGLALGSVLLAGTMAWAQQEPAPRGAGRGAGANPPVLTPAELERWFDSYVLLQAQDTLQLSDAQFVRVLPPLKALQGAMGGLLKANPLDEAALRVQLKALRDLEIRSADEVRRACDALDEVLDIRQQARFRMFEEQVERRKIDLLMKARQRGSQEPGTYGR